VEPLLSEELQGATDCPGILIFEKEKEGLIPRQGTAILKQQRERQGGGRKRPSLPRPKHTRGNRSGKKKEKRLHKTACPRPTGSVKKNLKKGRGRAKDKCVSCRGGGFGGGGGGGGGGGVWGGGGGGGGGVAFFKWKRSSSIFHKGGRKKGE